MPLPAAEKLASALQAKNKRFVSGYRFSDTKTSSKSDAPLGAERRKAAQRKNKTHLASVSGGWDSGALTISNLSAHSFPQPRRTHLLVPRNSKTKSSESRQIRHGWAKTVPMIVTDQPYGWQATGSNCCPPRYRLSSKSCNCVLCRSLGDRSSLSGFHVRRMPFGV